ncbi:ESX-4 secretion system protein eccD4 [Mycobacterium shigaense]|uniref:ESX-4 secretion system protein eccD4 n=1 Tax=Mycobacterium shigaense TaxID=722731 RepID=A0A1Z4EDV0_9MYCO|nr:ESX-4 secretion system protein eccD4 [Mycobacterium shigaense]
MSASDRELRRVSIHADGSVVDVALPSQMPVGTLIPPIVDIVEGRAVDRPPDPTARHYQLCRPGTAALHVAMTLAQNGIRDGDTLVLSRTQARAVVPRHDDVAEAVWSTLPTGGTDRPQRRHAARLTGAVAAVLFTIVGSVALLRNALFLNITRHFDATASALALAGIAALMFATIGYRAHRDAVATTTLGVIATVFVASAGFLAVPGVPGLANVLLAAMAAAVASTVVMRITGCGTTVFTAMVCFEVTAALAALAGLVTDAPLRAVSSVATLVSLGLLGATGRVSIILAGLAPILFEAPNAEPHADELPERVIRADGCLASLVAAFSSSAAAGAIATAVGGAPRAACSAFGALSATLLVLHGQRIQRRTLICVINGIVSTATVLGFAAVTPRTRGSGWPPRRYLSSLSRTCSASPPHRRRFRPSRGEASSCWSGWDWSRWCR